MDLVDDTDPRRSIGSVHTSTADTSKKVLASPLDSAAQIPSPTPVAQVTNESKKGGNASRKDVKGKTANQNFNLSQPSGVCVVGNMVFVADEVSNCIVRLDVGGLDSDASGGTSCGDASAKYDIQMSSAADGIIEGPIVAVDRIEGPTKISFDVENRLVCLQNLENAEGKLVRFCPVIE